MKVLSVILVTSALGACANQSVPMGAQSIGTSEQPTAAVAQCIARKWADRAQLPVVSQTMIANNQAVDIYLPGQSQPDGTAATVRTSRSPTNKTWVGYRAGDSAGIEATADISTCL
ncbi:hypothetical protein [Paraburkholderia adhaesiva]|uniref:hypothetical protein n=1 Tax=Paraburkholderia adhaesiva TaxID=2883244 RepID=UPI001F2E7B97|nr:hypothetical protein [Paraburkholderia adhaesiva]